MDAYTDFASVYDVFMKDAPYEQWAAYLSTLLVAYGLGKPKEMVGDLDKTKNEESVERRTVLDLGCGTGTMTELMAQQGYEMIGIDNSQDMLNIACAKRENTKQDILYLCQDMRTFELYGTVGAVISVCDSLNYLLDETDIYDTFCLVNNYLYPQGIFIFDFNTVYKYKEIIGDTTIAENREEGSFIWENYYHEEREINEYDITFFIKNNKQGEKECYQRFSETHYQRGYTLDQMRQLVERAGMVYVTAIDADSQGEVTDESERIYVIAREAGKEKTDG